MDSTLNSTRDVDVNHYSVVLLRLIPGAFKFYPAAAVLIFLQGCVDDAACAAGASSSSGLVMPYQAFIEAGLAPFLQSLRPVFSLILKLTDHSSVRQLYGHLQSTSDLLKQG